MAIPVHGPGPHNQAQYFQNASFRLKLLYYPWQPSCLQAWTDWKMRIGTTMQAYGEPSYWDERYSHESGPFDWYQKYGALAPLLRLYIPFHHQVLVVGCGNSGSTLNLRFLFFLQIFLHLSVFSVFLSMIAAFSEGMVNDGYREVVNIDISSVVIEAMRRKYSDRPQLKCILRNFQLFLLLFVCLLMDRIHRIWRGLMLN